MAALADELGPGNWGHQAIQRRLQEGGDALGFRTAVERPILAGAGSVDLVFEGKGRTIACEISVATTIAQEAGNIGRCIKAGFERIAVVAVSAERLEKLKAAVSTGFAPELSARVGYFLPDAFLAFLEDIQPLPPPAAVAPTPFVERRLGYKVTRNYVFLSAEETRIREADAVKIMAGAMRTQRPK